MPPLLLVLAGLSAYANSFDAPFVFDDRESIVDNANIRSLATSIGSFDGRGIVPRPLEYFTLAVKYGVDGYDVFGYHVVNLGIHLTAGLLLFGFLRRTMLLVEPAWRDSAIWPAAVAATVWTVHPLQTQAVTYTVQRCESLMGMFFLATMYCIVRGARSRRPALWYLAAVISSALGMASKEVMVVLPVVALLYVWVFLSANFRELPARRGWLHAGLFASLAVLFAIMWNLGFRAEAAVASEGTSLQYALTQASVIMHYIRLAVWPHPLVFDYGWPIAGTAGEIVPPLTIIVALLALTGWGLWRRKWWGFVGAWFFLILVPTSSILPIRDAAFEYRMYLSLAAAVVLFVVAIWQLWRRLESGPLRELATTSRWVRIAPAALSMGLVLALGGRTFLRNADYQSGPALWWDTVQKRPDNPRAYENLGFELMLAGQTQQGLEFLDRAIAMRPSEFALNNRGVAHRELQDFEQAIADFSRAIELKSDFVEAIDNRAETLAHLGQPAAAARDYSRVIELRPNLAVGYARRAELYTQLERHDAALKDYSKLIELKPNSAEVWYNRGNVHLDLGQLAAAQADFTRAVELRADFAEAYLNRAVSYLRSEDFERAIRDCRRALAADPKLALGYMIRAQAHLEQGRPRDAWRDVRSYEQLGGKPDGKFVQRLTDVLKRSS